MSAEKQSVSTPTVIMVLLFTFGLAMIIAGLGMVVSAQSRSIQQAPATIVHPIQASPAISCNCSCGQAAPP